MRYYRSTYSDGSIAVVDLAQPLSGAPAEVPAWGIHSSKDAVCSQVARQYFGNRTSAPPRS